MIERKNEGQKESWGERQESRKKGRKKGIIEWQERQDVISISNTNSVHVYSIDSHSTLISYRNTV